MGLGGGRAGDEPDWASCADRALPAFGRWSSCVDERSGPSPRSSICSSTSSTGSAPRRPRRLGGAARPVRGAPRGWEARISAATVLGSARSRAPRARNCSRGSTIPASTPAEQRRIAERPAATPCSSSSWSPSRARATRARRSHPRSTLCSPRGWTGSGRRSGLPWRSERSPGARSKSRRCMRSPRAVQRRARAGLRPPGQARAAVRERGEPSPLPISALVTATSPTPRWPSRRGRVCTNDTRLAGRARRRGAGGRRPDRLSPRDRVPLRERRSSGGESAELALRASTRLAAAARWRAAEATCPARSASSIAPWHWSAPSRQGVGAAAAARVRALRGGVLRPVPRDRRSRRGHERRARPPAVGARPRSSASGSASIDTPRPSTCAPPSAVVERRRGRSRGLGDELGLARAAYLMSDLAWLLGDPVGSCANAERMLAHARRAGSGFDVATALVFMAWSLVEGPWPACRGDRALRRARCARRAASELPSSRCAAAERRSWR